MAVRRLQRRNGNESNTSDCKFFSNAKYIRGFNQNGMLTKRPLIRNVLLPKGEKGYKRKPIINVSRMIALPMKKATERRDFFIASARLSAFKLRTLTKIPR